MSPQHSLYSLISHRALQGMHRADRVLLGEDVATMEWRTRSVGSLR
jgi:hypothetical protein